MIRFNPHNIPPNKLTIQDICEPACNCHSSDEAKEYLTEYIKYVEKCLVEEPRTDGKTAESICKDNIAYYAGYFDLGVRLRVEKLFGAVHPIFGSATNPVGPDKALMLGKMMAEIHKGNGK